MSSQKRNYPTCPRCGRRFVPGQQWYGINFCRATLLAEAISANPGSSTAELAGITGLPYSQALKGVAKLRDYGDEIVKTIEEDREQGDGFRYRYWIQPGWEMFADAWAEQVEQGHASPLDPTMAHLVAAAERQED